MKKGIDVSTFQGKIDWAKAKADGVEFAVLRAGYGRDAGQKDARFEENYAACRKLGIPVGAYWYSYAVTPEDAVLEAKACLSVLKGKSFAYPVYYDMEEASQAMLPSAQVEAIIQAFCRTMEQAGCWVGLYSYRHFLLDKCSESLLKRYAVWVADYTEKPSFPYECGMMQYSSSGSIAGIDGNVDLNMAYIAYPSQMQSAGLNDFSEGSPVTYTVQSGDTLTRIAARYSTTVGRILEENRSQYPSMTKDYIQVGWKLSIPQ